MPNNYFTFKQFTVQQEHCAMKVCTDACLFGAYVADLIKTKSSQHILDIGSGTGLLSLMLAQRVAARIDAVEIDAAAAQQATDNFKQSPWMERLTLYQVDINHFTTPEQYNCIVSNPPFFENDLKSNADNKNNAKHDTALRFDQLVTSVKKLLHPAGMFAVLLPFHRVNYFLEEARQQGLILQKKVLVKQTEKHDYFRVILIFGFTPAAVVEEEIVIKSADNKYTDRFSTLLKDYYLYL